MCIAGKDLASVGALLARHTRLEQDVLQRGDECKQLRDTATQLEASGNFMGDEISQRVDIAITRLIIQLENDVHVTFDR